MIPIGKRDVYWLLGLIFAGGMLLNLLRPHFHGAVMGGVAALGFLIGRRS